MTVTRFILMVSCIMLLAGLSMSNTACRNIDESVLEKNERILKRTFLWHSKEDTDMLAEVFTKLEVDIESAKIEEKVRRNGNLYGYIVRITDTTNNVYYLKIGKDLFWKFSIWENSLDGKMIYMNGADMVFPED
ncbi:MAG: hypothetical protein FWG78_01310 [Coriobacteriia bacterium]|nr:hypothetical protein [Coriobacteriia bacterium]